MANPSGVKSEGSGTQVGSSTSDDRGGSQPKYSPADDRSNIKNPTHPSHDADQANRRRQKSGG